MSISFAFGSIHKHSFQWNMGFKVRGREGMKVTGRIGTDISWLMNKLYKDA